MYLILNILAPRLSPWQPYRSLVTSVHPSPPSDKIHVSFLSLYSYKFTGAIVSAWDHSGGSLSWWWPKQGVRSRGTTTPRSMSVATRAYMRSKGLIEASLERLPNRSLIYCHVSTFWFSCFELIVSDCVTICRAHVRHFTKCSVCIWFYFYFSIWRIEFSCQLLCLFP
jgi:hypothetical protein